MYYETREGESMRELTLADIDDAFVERFYNDVIDGWFDGPIDWEQAFSRYERSTPALLPVIGELDLDDPVIQKLQRKVRALRRAA